MSNKDKIKELTGRSIDKYNDKIKEKTSKIKTVDNEQDRRLNILANEVDGDTLTKTEEGSVIPLDYSKDGLVYIDEIQGNTLVNYCIDGDKEMLLNGDIDLEGEGILTTTEGVDGGKVDVMCEGNTLVNCMGTRLSSRNLNCATFSSDKRILSFNKPSLDYNEVKIDISNTPLIQTNKTYTVYLNITKNTITRADESTNNIACKFNLVSYNVGVVAIPVGMIGKQKFIVTQPSMAICSPYIEIPTNAIGEFVVEDIVVIEGQCDYDYLEYFEGMKSVGELEDGNHKIEVLSRNKNLVEKIKLGGINNDDGALTESAYTVRSEGYICVKPNTAYTISNDLSYNNYIYEYDINKRFIVLNPNRINPCTFTTGENTRYITFRSTASEGQRDLSVKYQIEEGSTKTTYALHQFNTKQIQLQEPLRGLPNGVRDKFVKMSGKWYVERNCGEKLIDGNLENTISLHSINSFGIANFVFGLHSSYYGAQNVGICDKLPLSKTLIADAQTEGILMQGEVIYIRLSTSKCSTVEQFKQWIINNPMRFIYQLVTPTYELITDSELTTYLDTTHISNNSSIPCNMKVKNSGYNVIVKPNTLYTVALNRKINSSANAKNINVGINLAGAKANVTNEGHVIITTPNLLTDDSLRLYSKVKRIVPVLLEGDKANWLPKEFNGMKSSFEDGIINIKNRNSNLVNFNELDIKPNNDSVRRYLDLEVVNSNHIRLKVLASHKGYVFWVVDFPNRLKPNTQYKLNCKITKTDPNSNVAVRMFFSYRYDLSTILNETGSITFTTPSDVMSVRPQILFYSSIDNIEIAQDSVVDFENVMVTEVDSEFTLSNSNGLNLQLSEPLRGIDDCKDKICLKDGKLMIERIIGTYTTTGMERWISHIYTTPQYMFTGAVIPELDDRVVMTGIMCDKYPLYTKAAENLRYEQNFDTIWIGNTGSNNVLFMWVSTLKCGHTDDSFKAWLSENPFTIYYVKSEPTYEELPVDISKIILESYENSTLFLDTNIPPTVTTTYSADVPLITTTAMSKAKVQSNTQDINDIVVPYMLDMDYRMVCLQLNTEPVEGEISTMSIGKMFNGTFNMLKRDILSERLSKEEYKYRIGDYLKANKITKEQAEELEGLINE